MSSGPWVLIFADVRKDCVFGSLGEGIARLHRFAPVGVEHGLQVVNTVRARPGVVFGEIVESSSGRVCSTVKRNLAVPC